MAKFTTLKSVRANQLKIGEVYTMGFSKNTDTHSKVKFLGYFDSLGNKTEAPKILKQMPQDNVLKFIGEDEKIVVVVKDPAGYGAVFCKNSSGELKRVTFAE